MASVDVTSKVSRMNGVNSDANYVHTDAYRLPIMTLGIDAADSHPFAVLPAGVAITRIRIIPLVAVTSEGSATLQIAAKCGSADAVGLHTAVGKAKLLVNNIIDLPVNEKAAYFPSGEVTLRLVVGTAAVTAGDIIVLVDTIPVGKFLSNG